MQVHPFASLVGLVGENVPRLLINRERVGTDGQPLLKLLGFVDERALDFEEETQYRDALALGDCDSGATRSHTKPRPAPCAPTPSSPPRALPTRRVRAR